MASQDERYCFIAEWYDPNASINRKYQLFFYPKDNSIEMYDIKNRRTFLRRSKTEQVTTSMLYIGSTVNIHSRQLRFVDYGDDYSKRRLGSKKERTLGLIKPDAVSKMGPIIDCIYENNFIISQLKMCQLDRNDAMSFYREHQSKEFFNTLLNYICTGPVIAFELMGEDAVQKWRDLLGPTDSAVARSEAPVSIRARFGKDKTMNACHGSDSLESAARELEFFFPANGPTIRNTATFSNVTCCVIKPHAIKAGLTGKIINKIQEHGFRIQAIQMFTIEQANAEEFYEVYKGVVQEYAEMVTELTSGSCIALAVTGDSENIPQDFRDMVGPSDPEIARHLRPRTLRAQFGRDKIHNAVHCSDLPEDGQLEVEYFFKILDR